MPHSAHLPHRMGSAAAARSAHAAGDVNLQRFPLTPEAACEGDLRGVEK